MKRAVSFILVVVAACGGDDGTNPANPDAPGPGSGSDGSSFPATITISGSAIQQTQSGETPEPGVTINAFLSSNDSSPIATATTDGSGNYSMTLTTHGAAIDGYFKATKSGLVDTYVYPPVPMAKDESNAVASVITTANYNGLQGIEGTSASNGMIILVVLDSSATNPISGATVQTTPAAGTVRYMDSSMQPFGTTATNTDGLAFLFDVPPSGTVSVAASKSGMTFMSHSLKARAGALTTTIVQAQ